MFLSPIKKAISKYSKLMYDRGYSTASEGNISVKINDNLFLITPSRFIKSFIKPNDIVLIDSKGNPVKGKNKPTTERFTHLEIYNQNKEAKCIIHAHPFYTVLLTLLDIDPFKDIFLPEAIMFLNKTVIAPYAKPSTTEGATSVKDYAKDYNNIVIKKHGSFSIGKNLDDAFSLLEILEKYSKFYFFSILSGKEISYLNDIQKKELLNIPY